MSEPLKIGLLIDGNDVPKWAESIIRSLSEEGHGEITLIIRNKLSGQPSQIQESEQSSQSPAGSFLLKLRRMAARVGFSAFQRLESIVNRRDERFATPYAISDLLPDTPILDVEPEQTKYNDRFSEHDVKTVEAAGLDILFRLGFRILKGDILRATKYGIWSYHHGDNRTMRGGPSGFWELVGNVPIHGVILQVLNDDLDGGKVLSRSWHSTDILLLNRQRQNVFMQAASQFPREVKRLHTQGAEKYFASVDRDNQHPDFYSQKLFTPPNSRQVLWHLGKHYLEYLVEKLFGLLFYRQWVLLVCMNQEEHIAHSMWRYKQILPPRDRMWADPFVIKRDDKFYVYIEELEFADNKGYISVLTFNADGSYSEPVPVIKQPYHMSYPFLLEYENELYMIPETAENRTIDLYKCTEFPNKWEFQKSLMTDVFGVDATVMEYDGRWWMFVTLRDNEETNCLDELHLFHADSPLSSEWVPHPMNPVKTDVRNARPAGAPFQYGENLYRPAQNSGKHYGYGIEVNLIRKLSVDDYRESSVSSVEPHWDWSVNATHTLNHTQGCSVSDARKARLRLLRKLEQILKR